jgi:hypothetical protein
MHRLERVEPSHPDRPGINPFTKQPIVIRGRSRRITSVAVCVDGNEVTLSWTWVEEGKPTCQPHVEKHRLKDSSDAEAYLRECLDELTSDGFRDLDGPPYRTSGDEASAIRTAPASSAGIASMAVAIVRRCRDQTWFGCDMHRKYEQMRSGDSIEERRFRFPPATDLQLAETERLLGFALPVALRGLYKEVANGGFGPGYGIVGAVGGARDSEGGFDIAEMYRLDRQSRPFLEESGVERGDSGWFEPFYNEWPRRVLRFVHWGCCIWSCIDARTGRVLRYEPLHGRRDREAMVFEATSLEQWMERWLRGEELF